MLNYVQVYCYQEQIADTETLVVRPSRACVAVQLYICVLPAQEYAF